MDFNQAIAAHAEWKIKLRLYLNGQGDLNPHVICQDNQCVLGKWIYGEGAGFSYLPEFDHLRHTHAQFHKCAAGIVDKINRGDRESATQALAPGSEFTQLSSEITVDLMKIKRAAVAA